MRWFEALASALLLALGLRSLVHWLRLSFAGEDAADHVLFGLFVLGRVGVWWSLAGLFAIYATISRHLAGRAFTDEIRTRFWWYPVVVLVFAAVQLVAGILLGRRAGRSGRRAPRSG